MLLVIDVGNTNIKLGVYKEDKLVTSWRMSVKVTRTSDEFGITMLNLFASEGMTFSDIDGIIMSSVSPSLNYTIEHACEYYMKITPIVIGVGIKTGLNIKYSNPQELGADRIVNSVAAYKLYGGPCVIVDFGTATTFNVISDRGEFLGGCIAPGIKSSLDSLVNNAAKLPRVELSKPDNVINKNTIANIQAGTIYGFTGLVDYIVKKIKKETGYGDMKVIATGGLSQLVVNEKEDIIDVVDRYLTLKGLKFIFDMNKSVK
ncbi:MAG: type III pantothenate kinase [Clostridia bacterium]|jgi:type III pantothenate kinase|nr:type III pantothenate kinase [Clostridia bacterium]MCX4367145.1 type III pantothenate kinase [Clostridia bacterium]